MAVDSKAKRMSAMLHQRACTPMMIAPDGTIDQGDRQSVAYIYCGILAGTAAAGSRLKIYKYGAAAKGVRGWR